jgi:CheY-like chemotaxis protein/anti-sigma regulatory factor (Ser/Thr protein kinase)
MYIDQGCVDKIVYNLLSNAFKYTPRKGDVTVRVKRKDGQIIIRVEDSGVGVPPEKQAQLFTRFMQTNLAADSMGIGLNFTQKLVEAHHGEIHYEDNPSGGSVFVVSLPESVESYQPEDLMVPTGFSDDKAEEEVVMMQSYKELAAEPLNDRTVLVVEDDEDVREYICGEVSAYFKVRSVQNGAEALELLQGDTVVDLVLSDIKMPIMDGIQLLKKVRADDALFDIPFILLTAMGSIEKQLQGARYGADAYIPKPFSPALLIGKCISLIKQRDRLKAAYSQAGSDSSDDKDGTSAAPLIVSERDRKFREIVDIKIASNIDNPDFVVDDLAQVTGYGRSQFFSKMMEVTGKTPKEYIRMKRMMKAAELLRSGEMVTVAEVAYKVGFTDSLYFSRCFKQYFGMTPSKYQKG